MTRKELIEKIKAFYGLEVKIEDERPYRTQVRLITPTGASLFGIDIFTMSDTNSPEDQQSWEIGGHTWNPDRVPT